ncbi:glycosyltransferase family 2 protein [Geothrix edaphica]|uniref:Glycosyltransferase 2-like domain-containing protein n=1 Tax=Geothrix edaphica TaxID=2927976 RepID=A0ABQ5PXR6_9BACT|nr:glycosyltransferase family A protein [Geothrix edaphica]GLH66875.1 hypothetical protein GETHED_12390 [Geothrix edaphica]
MLKWVLRKLLAGDFRNLERQIRAQGEELDALRSRMDLDPSLVRAFHQTRVTEAYLSAYDEVEPLVSVCVATYNRAALLTERCLASILTQTYHNLDVVVVGDACTDDTPERVAALGDSRIRFENLPTRGSYPQDPDRRWMVAGTIPINRALELAKGRFITHLDDDDSVPADRIAKLVAYIKETQADLLWHPFEYETAKGKWRVNSALEFRKAQVTTSSVFYHEWLKNIPWDLDAHQYLEPGDWNRFRKIQWIGARVARHPDLLLRHFKERNNSQ